MNQGFTGVHQQRFYADSAKPVQTGPQLTSPVQMRENVEAPYRSVMERQWMSLEGRIDFMANALETLEQRLAPVMRDTPCKTMEESLPCADSPMGRKLENFNSRMNAMSEHILHIIERLEV